MSVKFLLLGGGLGGRGSADFIFMGARIFLSFGPALSEALFGTFPGRGFRTYGRQDRKNSTLNTKESFTFYPFRSPTMIGCF